MITKQFETREEWLEERKGKITGSRLNNLVVKRGTGEKIGFYEIIAERIAQESDGEDAMERGNRLEEEAIEIFSKVTGKKVDTSLVLWEREDNKSIAISPDGFIGETEAVEVKCLSSARHIEAYLTKEIPSEYEFQVLQYFIVNETLKTLWFVMYDARMPEKLQMHYFEVKREDKEEDIEKYLNYQKEKLETIERIITELTF
jgi:putative phage-type endonuclease